MDTWYSLDFRPAIGEFPTTCQDGSSNSRYIMTLQGQRVQASRYTLIPRTLSFLVRQDSVLLIQIPEDRGAWSGRLNGIGGHIEQGEDPLSSALREIREETGLEPVDLKLCGVVIVDTGTKPGIGLYVFVGGAGDNKPQASLEGSPTWIPQSKLESYQLVEDIPILLPRALQSYDTGVPFSAFYQYDENDQLVVKLLP
ncbi:MAG: NUDIX domain-containing protein [Anaerolineales bacterium]|nr:NUDIX domain-containing protein [Anaerolineales bacterium]